MSLSGKMQVSIVKLIILVIGLTIDAWVTTFYQFSWDFINTCSFFNIKCVYYFGYFIVSWLRFNTLLEKYGSMVFQKYFCLQPPKWMAVTTLTWIVIPNDIKDIEDLNITPKFIHFLCSDVFKHPNEIFLHYTIYFNIFAKNVKFLGKIVP